MNIGAKAAAGDGDRFVLMLIGGGIIALILAVIVTMAVATLPEWAESVFSTIVGGAIVKLADVLSTLVALSGSRQIGKMSDQLSSSAPAPQDPSKTTVEE
jgi:hypothetical protein